MDRVRIPFEYNKYVYKVRIEAAIHIVAIRGMYEIFDRVPRSSKCTKYEITEQLLDDYVFAWIQSDDPQNISIDTEKVDTAYHNILLYLDKYIKNYTKLYIHIMKHVEDLQDMLQPFYKF